MRGEKGGERRWKRKGEKGMGRHGIFWVLGGVSCSRIPEKQRIFPWTPFKKMEWVDETEQGWGY